MTEVTSIGFPLLRPEEEELDRLETRLAELREELADRELELATSRRRLLVFQQRYLAIVGRRLAELDQLEAQIAVLRAARDPSPEAEQEARASEARARESSDALGDDPDVLEDAAAEPQPEVSEELKKLYRQVAKAVHPDFAADDDDRALRDRLMAEANVAYEAGDVDKLETILKGWQSRPEDISEDGVGAQLVHAIRSIAAVEARLAELADEIASCAQGTLAELYAESLHVRAEGRDLLQEMANEVDGRIAAARLRLRALSDAANPEELLWDVARGPSVD